MLERRHFLRAATAVGSVFAGSALAQNATLPDPAGTVPPPRDWNHVVTLYPDPACEVFDQRALSYCVRAAS